jgi:hypothetical protein
MPLFLLCSNFDAHRHREEQIHREAQMIVNHQKELLKNEIEAGLMEVDTDDVMGFEGLLQQQKKKSQRIPNDRGGRNMLSGMSRTKF